MINQNYKLDREESVCDFIDCQLKQSKYVNDCCSLRFCTKHQKQHGDSCPYQKQHLTLVNQLQALLRNPTPPGASTSAASIEKANAIYTANAANLDMLDLATVQKEFFKSLTLFNLGSKFSTRNGFQSRSGCLSGKSKCSSSSNYCRQSFYSLCATNRHPD